MMIDLRCKFCKGKLEEEQLRVVNLNGVVCLECGGDQNVRYIQVRGTGKRQVVQYESRGKMLFPKRVEYLSCQYCSTYWNKHGDVVFCPFCGMRLREPEMEGRFVPRSKNNFKK